MRYVADLEAVDSIAMRRNITAIASAELTKGVESILTRVATEGDRGLIALTEAFDGILYSDPDAFKVPVEVLENALITIEEGVKIALMQAADNIRTFHAMQLPSPVIWDQPGKRVILRQDPLSRVALYVPGGLAAYPSSVLMNAIPAQVAGVKEIAVFTPPTRDLRQLEAVYAACALLGLTEVYALGGAQAVAAAAFGTQTIPPCDLITGPGNQYVTEAKRQVMDRVKIDMLAGPSELLVVADSTADAEFVAADLLAQAEHDPQAGLFLVLLGTEAQTQQLSKRITGALRDLLVIEPSQNAAISIQNLLTLGCQTVTLAAAISNRIAPEHLSLQFVECEASVDLFTVAGSIFVGSYTPEAVADYAAGANHVLPTAGTSRFASSLGVATFLKATQVVTYTEKGLAADGLASMVLAQRERLPYHAKSLALRLSGERSAGASAGPITGASTGASEVTGAGTGSCLKLSANENPEAYWLSAEVSKNLALDLPQLVRTYPADGYPQMEALLSEALVNLFPEKGPSLDAFVGALSLGNGSDELLDVLFRALFPRQSQIALLNPSFSEYQRFLTINELVARPIASDSSTAWYDEKLLLDQLIEASRTCSGLLICNPNNPTGQRFSTQWLKTLIESVPETCLIILDEAYMDFCPDQDKDPWYALKAPNVIQVRTLSKAYGAAGLRFGYTLMSPALNQKLKPFLAPYRLSHPTAALAVQALKVLGTDSGKDAFLKNRSALNREKGALTQALMLDSGDSRGGNFLWVKLSLQQRQAIENAHLKIRTFTGPWDSFARITMGNPLQMSLLKHALLQGAIAHDTHATHVTNDTRIQNLA